MCLAKSGISECSSSSFVICVKVNALLVVPHRSINLEVAADLLVFSAFVTSDLRAHLTNFHVKNAPHHHKSRLGAENSDRS